MELNLMRVMSKIDSKYRPFRKGDRIRPKDEWWNGSKWIVVSEDSGDVGLIFNKEDCNCEDGSIIKWRRKRPAQSKYNK